MSPASGATLCFRDFQKYKPVSSSVPLQTSQAPSPPDGSQGPKHPLALQGSSLIPKGEQVLEAGDMHSTGRRSLSTKIPASSCQKSAPQPGCCRQAQDPAAASALWGNGDYPPDITVLIVTLLLWVVTKMCPRPRAGGSEVNVLLCPRQPKGHHPPSSP